MTHHLRVWVVAGSILLLGYAPAGARDLRVVAAIWEWNNRIEYLAGETHFVQSEAPANTKLGTVFNVFQDKGGTAAQATRQSLDGTFGSATGLLNWEDQPIAADTMSSRAVRINDQQVLSLLFTNVSGQAIELGNFHFDYGRSFATSPTTIQLRIIDPDGIETVLRTHTTNEVHGSIGYFDNIDVSLAAYTIPAGAQFTLLLQASGGSSGGNLDNAALTAWRPQALPEPSLPAVTLAFLEGMPDLVATSESGFRYQVESSLDLVSWSAVGETQEGTGEPLRFAPPAPSPDLGFFRITVSPADLPAQSPAAPH